MPKWFLACADHKDRDDSVSTELGRHPATVAYTEKAVNLWPAISQFEKRAFEICGRVFDSPFVAWKSESFDFDAFKVFMVQHGSCEIYLLNDEGLEKPVAITYGASWHGANPLKTAHELVRQATHGEE